MKHFVQSATVLLETLLVIGIWHFSLNLVTLLDLDLYLPARSSGYLPGKGED